MTAADIAAARKLCEPSGLPTAQVHPILTETRAVLLRALNEVERLREFEQCFHDQTAELVKVIAERDEANISLSASATYHKRVCSKVEHERGEAVRALAQCVDAMNGVFKGITDSGALDMNHDEDCPEDDTCECECGRITNVASKAFAEALSLTRRLAAKESK